MKKLISFILPLVFSYAAFAQPTAEQKKLLFNKIDSLINNYIRYSNLLESGKSKVSETSVKNFRQLFVSDDIMIPDEMNPVYFDKNQPDKPKVPSYTAMEKEASQLKGKIPSATGNYANSISAMNIYAEGLDNYIKSYNAQRTSFYQAYNDLSKNMDAYYNALGKQENIVTRKLSEYIDLSQTNYPDGLSVRMLNSVVNLKNISSNEVKVMIEKRTEGKLTGSGVKLENRDTLVLTLKLSQGYSKVQISAVEMIGHQLNFLNDKDHDFVSDANDACQTEKGMFQPNGCPSADEKNFTTKMSQFLADRKADSTAVITAQADIAPKRKVLQAKIDDLTKQVEQPAHWWITLGVSGGSVSGSLTSTEAAYDSPVNGKNSDTKFSGGTSFGADLMIEHYFGAKAKFGIGLGLSYLSGSGKLKKDVFHVEFKAKDKAYTGNGGTRPGGNEYRQIISLHNGVAIEEKIKTNNLSIPIVLAYKTNISEKIGFKVEAGIVYNLSYNSKMSSTNARFDYEAVYKFKTNTSSTHPETEYDNGVVSPNSWQITQAQVKDGKVDEYFTHMSGIGYRVGINVAPMNQSSSTSLGSGIGFLIRPSLSYNFNKGSYINLGVFYSSNSLSPSGSGKRLIDEDYNYNGLMEGVSKLSANGFGIRLSYSHSLFYNVPKWTRELSGLR